MWNVPSEKMLAKLPKLYSTENIPIAKKKIHIHFFTGGSDWFIAEYDPKDRLFFGYAILNMDLEMAEWGYISFDELKSIRTGFTEIDRDRYWKVKTFEQAMKDYKMAHGL